jgi:manganese/zinc/iron transport system permease protein
MTSSQIEIQLIAAAVALSCSLTGTFLVLRRLALMSDAIGHSILLGIVGGFLITRDVASPVLILGASLTGVLTVALVEALQRTGLVKKDAAIGLVFPALFSVAVILIAQLSGNAHLDTDMVLLGELAFAPFERVTVGGVDLGPKALVVSGSILVINVAFLFGFYKEMKIATFDAGLAAAIGISPAVIHYGFMSLVSVTAVGAFDAVGTILVVALMIAPPAAAYMLTSRLSHMLAVSGAIGVASALSGYWIAHVLDASIAGSMATAAGGAFVLAWIFAPDRGLVVVARRRQRQALRFAHAMIAVHLLQHEGTEDEARECRISHLSEHLSWPEEEALRVTRTAARRGLLDELPDGVLRLTDDGRKLAAATLTE